MSETVRAATQLGWVPQKSPTPHQIRDTVNALNLAEGEDAVVEIPTNAFDRLFFTMLKPSLRRPR